ncbi:MAG: EAL domain-containing protein [Pseudomonadota bacterium]
MFHNRPNLLFLGFTVVAIAVALLGSFAFAAISPLEAVTFGLAIFLAGAIVQERTARRNHEAYVNRRLEMLQRAYDGLLEQIHRSPARAEGQNGSTSLSLTPAEQKDNARVDAVIAEVKVLQDLIQRLATNRQEPAPTAEDPSQNDEELGASETRVMVSDNMAPAHENTVDTSPSSKDLAPQPDAPRDQVATGAEIHQLRPYPKELSDNEILAIARDALQEDRVELVLQPIVSLPQRKKLFYECFSRLRTKDGFTLTPDRYLDLAEREGLVTAIDNMMLFRCFQLIRKIQRRGEDFDFFCNLSSHTLSDEAFFTDFADFLAGNTGLAKNLVFEFTQADYENWNLSSAEQLAKLAKLGCRFSIDQVSHLDFNPVALASSGVCFIKVKAELLAGLGANATTLLHDLRNQGVNLIVEKIEKEETLVEILDYDVGFAQGYLFGEPRMARPAA